MKEVGMKVKGSGMEGKSKAKRIITLALISYQKSKNEVTQIL